MAAAFPGASNIGAYYREVVPILCSVIFGRCIRWKYLAFDKYGWLYVPVGPPCNVCLTPSGTSQIRRIDPKTGLSELVAIGVRNSVGGDVDPRTGEYWFTENARDWVSDDLPSDKLNHITRIGQHFGYPYCHQGNMPDPKFAMGHKCSEFTPPTVNLGAHVAPLGMKFYTGDQFPAQYKNNIFIAEHGSWNGHKYQGARIRRVVTDASGKTAKAEVFASGWIEGDQGNMGRPDEDIRALGAYIASLPPPVAPAQPDSDAVLSETGKAVVARNRCASCHKDNFAGIQATARLAAQREDYLLKALRDFKSGTRVGGGVSAMADAVFPMNDNDMKAAAHSLARFK